MATVEERAEIVAQRIWVDVSDQQLSLTDRFTCIKDRIAGELAAARAEGAVGTIAIRLPPETFGYQIDHLTLTHEEHPHEWNEYVLVPAPVLAPDKVKL
jgi:hypothetical protein